MAKTKWPPFYRRHKIVLFWFKFHRKVLLLIQLTIHQYCFRYIFGSSDQATSFCLNQWWPCSLTHICVTRLRQVNKLLYCSCHKLQSLLLGFQVQLNSCGISLLLILSDLKISIVVVNPNLQCILRKFTQFALDCFAGITLWELYSFTAFTDWCKPEEYA